jgi:hypothetical protein
MGVGSCNAFVVAFVELLPRALAALPWLDTGPKSVPSNVKVAALLFIFSRAAVARKSKGSRVHVQTFAEVVVFGSERAASDRACHLVKW